MRYIPYVLPVILLMYSCKSTSYHYVSPTLNNTAYAPDAGGHLGIQFGSVGLGAKGGVAITENINLNGVFGGIPESDNGYTSRESEFSLGFQSTPRNNKVTTVYLGMGIGNNEKDKIGLSGNYNRPFVQVQRATFDKPIFSGKVHVDGNFGMRLNYLLYNGKLGAGNYDENVFYTEPYFGFAIGGRNVRFEILQGVAIKMSGTWHEDVRIFPYFGNVGVLFKFRKGKKTD